MIDEVRAVNKNKLISYIYCHYNFIIEVMIGPNGTKVFHWEFYSFPSDVGAIHSHKLFALGKKNYLDFLADEEGNECYHLRAKGIPKQCIINKCKRMCITVEELYLRSKQWLNDVETYRVTN